MELVDAVRNAVRKIMGRVARVLNTATGGALSPNAVTVVGFLAHVPVAGLIAQGYFGYAAVVLIVFGLFDTLDGELARLQKRASPAGMLLDASTDRMKEVLLYTGAAYYFVNTATSPLFNFAIWCVVACGASLCVSYVKAKGETALKDSNLNPNEINRLFQDGMARFEIRMFFLVVGLALNRLEFAIVFIALLSSITAIFRLINISHKLK